MLRITKSKSASAAQAYFREALISADYYMEGRSVIGRWSGLAAARLGLVGDVVAAEFEKLLRNRTPQGEKLTPRDKADRVPGIDFTIHAPKDVSLLSAIGGDERIREAHRRAVSAMMAEVERNMEVRVRRGAKAKTQATRKTGNAIWSEFEHDTARPVDGSPDPHLHTHCYLLNASWDEKERRFKAAEIGNIAADRVYFEAVYHAALSREMKQLGYGIERRGAWWSVKGLSRALIEKFSRRTAEIEAEAATEGSTPEQKAALGVRTRGRKLEPLAYEDLRGHWLCRLTPRQRQEIEAVLKAAESGGETRSRGVVDAWDYALQDALTHRSVAFEKRVLTEALRYGFGDVTLSDLRAASDMTTLIRGEIEGRSVLTTTAALEEEDLMIQVAKRGRNACRSLGSGDYGISRDGLNDGQRGAIHHIWSSADRIMVIRGAPGVGKTKGVLAEAAEGLRAAGHRVVVAAPTGTATEEMRGDVSSDAMTVARLLKAKEDWPKLKGSVVIVDEASMIGVPDMASLMTLAEAFDFRLVLCGDEKQHGSVQRGDAFRLLRERAGVKTPEISEIVRQNGAYRDAVETVDAGDIDLGWKRLEQLGAVIETPLDGLNDEAAADAVGEIELSRSVLVVAPTRRERDDINAKIREKLKAADLLPRDERSFLKLVDTDWSEAKRSDRERYQVGQVIKFFQNVAGVAMSGERLTVTKIENGKPLLSNGQAAPLDRAKDFRVYETRTIDIAPGDRLRIAAGGKSLEGKRLDTGRVVEVERFDEAGDIVLKNGWRIAQDFGHLDHGYASTSMAGQSRTVDAVIGALSTASLPAINRKEFLVDVSRGRQAVRLYVDDVEAVRKATKRSGDRVGANEFVEGAVAKDLSPGRSERLADWERSVAAQVKRLAKQQGGKLEIDKEMLREAKRLAMAQHKGRVAEKGAELGD